MTNEEMFEKNMKLAYKIANKYRTNYIEEYEDIKQIALLGLWNAVLTFKHTYVFSTYAYPVISNTINMYLRKNKKHKNNISIETEFKENLTIADTLEDDQDYILQFHDKEEIAEMKQTLKSKWSNLNIQEQNVIAKTLQGKTQTEIAKDLGTSQVQVSRVRNRLKKKLGGSKQ